MRAEGIFPTLLQGRQRLGIRQTWLCILALPFTSYDFSSFLLCELNIIIVMDVFFSHSYSTSLHLPSGAELKGLKVVLSLWLLVTFNHWVLEVEWQREVHEECFTGSRGLVYFGTWKVGTSTTALSLSLKFGNSLLSWASLVAETVKNLPAMRETWIQSLGWENPLEKGKAIYSSILAWRIPWTEEPGRLQSMGSQSSGHYWATFTFLSSL